MDNIQKGLWTVWCILCLCYCIIILSGCCRSESNPIEQRWVSDGEIGCWEMYNRMLTSEEVNHIMNRGCQLGGE